MKVKNVSNERVGILSFGDIKPGQTVDLPDHIWTAIKKQTWPNSKPYRCDQIKFLKPIKEKKPKKDEKISEPEPVKTEEAATPTVMDDSKSPQYFTSDMFGEKRGF